MTLGQSPHGGRAVRTFRSLWTWCRRAACDSPQCFRCMRNCHARHSDHILLFEDVASLRGVIGSR